MEKEGPRKPSLSNPPSLPNTTKGKQLVKPTSYQQPVRLNNPTIQLNNSMIQLNRPPPLVQINKPPVPFPVPNQPRVLSNSLFIIFFNFINRIWHNDLLGKEINPQSHQVDFQDFSLPPQVHSTSNINSRGLGI